MGVTVFFSASSIRTMLALPLVPAVVVLSLLSLLPSTRRKLDDNSIPVSNNSINCEYVASMVSVCTKFVRTLEISKLRTLEI
jgi:hypothetical protein